jgi:type I restriction enzyme, S subunit
MGQSPDSACINDDEEGLPFLQGCAEFGRREPMPELYCSPPVRVAPQDSVLISVRAPVGTMNWADQRYCIGRGLGSIKGRDGASDTRFLRYALADGVHYLHRRSQGSTFLAIGSEDLRSFPVPGFAFGVQQKISQVLGAADIAIEKTEALIDKYRQIKAGLMHDLFTRGIGADGKLRPPREQAPELYQETPIGWIPKEWGWAGLRTKALPGVPHIKTGPFGSALKGEHWREDGVPVITIGALGDGIFEHSELLFISDCDADRLVEYRLKSGEVVFSRVADVGRSVVVAEGESGWVMSSNLMRISLDRQAAVPQFLQYQLAYDVRLRSQIRCKVNSGGRDVANSEVLNSLRFVWPEPAEQHAIVDRANSVSRRIDSESSLLAKLHNEKRGLMADLLSGRVEVANV